MVSTTLTTPNGLPPEHETGDVSGGQPDGDGPNPFRTMPHNLEAEKSLLGAIFVNNRAYEAVSEFLRPEHFAYPQHGRIFEAASKLIERGQIADPITLKRYFEADENLADIGGPAYLAELAGSAVTVINAGEYGNVIYDLYLKRELIALGEDVVNAAYGGAVEDTATSQIEVAEQSLYDLATSGDYEGGFVPFRDSVIAAIEIATNAHNRQGGLAGVGSGFRDIDRLLGGMHSSDLLILAGRPSMGKTALATNMAFNAAKDYYESDGREGAVVGFFSLEMSAEQLASRILSEQSHISSDRMRKGELATEEFNRLSAASTTLHNIPIFIDDTPALT
ncbi:MAG: replicative DNA helicase, partial [Rhodospirillales bacterium]|nr:replicative DNA helicase [Rhodospirillales bacterium]